MNRIDLASPLLFDGANVWFCTMQVGQEKAAKDKGLGQASSLVCYPFPS
jgi:hypothetical protein